jgi:DNA-binding XRE family transcriptional regulator
VRFKKYNELSRQTIVAIENGKRPLPWNFYLAVVLVFTQNEDSKKILDSFELFDGKFLTEIKL